MQENWLMSRPGYGMCQNFLGNGTDVRGSGVERVSNMRSGQSRYLNAVE